MVIDYTFFYVEANIVCIIIFALLLLGNLGGVDRQEKQRLFAGTLISHMLYFFVDIAWVLMLGGYIPSLRLNLSILNILLAVILSTLHREDPCNGRGSVDGIPFRILPGSCHH